MNGKILIWTYLVHLARNRAAKDRAGPLRVGTLQLLAGLSRGYDGQEAAFDSGVEGTPFLRGWTVRVPGLRAAPTRDQSRGPKEEVNMGKDAVQHSGQNDAPRYLEQHRL
jgi:hypothetical protein